MYFAEEKQLFQLVTYFQSTEFQKEQPFVTLNHQSAIKDHILDVLVHMPPLLVTLMMEPEPESDYHQVQEKQSQVYAEPLLESLLVEVETKSQ
jgi:hypothetical protein